MDQMGKKIRRKRENLGFHIKELSNKIGVTTCLISQIERGKASPSIFTLDKIAKTLYTIVDDLFYMLNGRFGKLLIITPYNNL